MSLKKIRKSLNSFVKFVAKNMRKKRKKLFVLQWPVTNVGICTSKRTFKKSHTMSDPALFHHFNIKMKSTYALLWMDSVKSIKNNFNNSSSKSIQLSQKILANVHPKTVISHTQSQTVNGIPITIVQNALHL